MIELSEGVNWLAVIVGFIAAYALGMLWYSPKLFGNAWCKGCGIEVDYDNQALPKLAMLIQAIGTFLFSWLVGITAASDALLTILLVGVTLALLIASAGLYAKKSSDAVIIEATYVIAMLVIMIICQGLF